MDLEFFSKIQLEPDCGSDGDSVVRNPPIFFGLTKLHCSVETMTLKPAFNWSPILFEATDLEIVGPLNLSIFKLKEKSL